MFWGWRNLPTMYRAFEELKKEMENLTTYTEVSDFPVVNFWRGKDGAILTAQMPGLSSENIEISVVGQTVTISGNYLQPELKEKESFLRKERKTGKFTKTYELPFKIDSEKTEAVFDKGILQLNLPQAEADKPKTVSIKAL